MRTFKKNIKKNRALSKKDKRNKSKKSKKKGKIKRKNRRVFKDSNNDGVTELTDANFEVETNGKVAMIEFYAPWCGHCNAFKSTYHELGTRFAKTDIIIGAMDATVNNTPDYYNVIGYPTLIFKTTSGTIIPYNGNRDLNSLTEFINEHSQKN